jgi:hypothetical protein
VRPILGWAIGLALLVGMVALLLLFVFGVIPSIQPFNPWLLIFPILLVLGIFGDRSRRR